MTGDTAVGMQLDDELEGSPERAAAVFAENVQKNLRTCQPGIVRNYDPATQTAQVQATIRRLIVGQGFVDLPLCVDVPVQFPAGGPFVLTFPLAADDEGILVFSDRAIDFWWDRGGIQDPSEYRLHDLSDAFFVPGVSSRPRFLTGVATDAAELRTRDGTVLVRATADGVVLNGGSAGVARTGDAVRLTLTADDMTLLATALLATGGFTPSGSAPAGSAPVLLDHGEITGGSATVKAGD